MYVDDVAFRDFIYNFRNVRGVPAIAAKTTFQEKLVNLEQ
jgi:hypothetical protein